MTSAKDREEFLLEERARIDAELDELRKEPESAERKVPEARIAVAGTYVGNAYPEQHEYEVCLRLEADFYLLELRTSGDDVIARMEFGEDAAQDILSTINSDLDDPRGTGLGLYYDVHWQVGDIQNDVLLSGSHLEEVAAWFNYATGAEVWDWDEQGEEWDL